MHRRKTEVEAALRPARGQGRRGDADAQTRGDRINPASRPRMLSALQAELDRVAKRRGHEGRRARGARASTSARGTTCARCACTPARPGRKALFEQWQRDDASRSCACPQPVIARVQGVAVAAGCPARGHVRPWRWRAKVAQFALPGIKRRDFLHHARSRRRAQTSRAKHGPGDALYRRSDRREDRASPGAW